MPLVGSMNCPEGLCALSWAPAMPRPMPGAQSEGCVRGVAASVLLLAVKLELLPLTLPGPPLALLVAPATLMLAAL